MDLTPNHFNFLQKQVSLQMDDSNMENLGAMQVVLYGTILVLRRKEPLSARSAEACRKEAFHGIFTIIWR